MILSLVIAITATYFVTQTAGYYIHKLVHLPISGSLYESHRIHHDELFPTSDFISEVYRNGPFKKGAVVLLLLLLIVGTVMLLFLPVWLAALLSIEMVLIALFNDWMHQKIHLRGNFLERFQWFQRKRHAHFAHHVEVKTNYGIMDMSTDRILRTYRGSQEDAKALER